MRVLLCALLTSTVVAQTNLILNGGFETGPSIATGQTQVGISGSMLPNWVIPYGNCDLNGPFWSPSEGSRSVDLHGVVVGAIEQTVATRSGWRYRLTFDLGATGQTASMKVVVGTIESPVFSHTDVTFPSVSYALGNTWEFVAESSASTVRLVSLSSSSQANGPHVDNVRLVELGPAASFTSFGSGCQGSSGTPALTAASIPVLGQVFPVTVAPVPPVFGLVLGVFGLSNSTSSGQPLPRALDGFGMPGCQQLVSTDVVNAFLTSGGSAVWTILIPSNPGLLGLPFYLQAFVPDAAANPLGVVVSQGASGLVGV